MHATQAAQAVEPGGEAVFAPKVLPDRDELVYVIQTIDRHSQVVGGRIQATGRVLLAAMHSPTLYRDSGIADVAVMVKAMVDAAEDLSQGVTAQAMAVDANALRGEHDELEYLVIASWQAAAEVEAAKGGEA